MVVSDELMQLGTRCPTCKIIDFLPLRCSLCHEAYCSDHWKPPAHDCSAQNLQKGDVLPRCPLCGRPVALEASDDPNVPMEDHLNARCSKEPSTDHTVDDVWLRRKQKILKTATPRCSHARCSIKSALTCDGCRKPFCPTHRFPKDHECPTMAKATPPSVPRIIPNSIRKQHEDAMFDQIVNAPRQDKQQPDAGRPNTQKYGSYKQTKKRATKEIESRIRALRFRAQKGLLSDDEKYELAEYEAEHKPHLSSKPCNVQ